MKRLALLTLFLVSCQAKRPEQASPQANTPPPAATDGAAGTPKESAAAKLRGAGAYEVIQVTGGGSLAVTALYRGEPIPQQTEVPVNIDVHHCGHKVFTESLLVDPQTRGIENVVVRLEGIAKGKAPPPTVTVTNKNCAFTPHVSVAVKGTKIDIRSEDPVLHTTHPYIDGWSFFNLPLQPGEAPPGARPIPRSGLMEIRCDVHKWMKGYMLVHTNPYAAVTDKLGKLTITEIPPGKYPYAAWHEELGEQKGEVEIVAGGTAELKLEFQRKEG